jgi:fumarate reductase subunit D
MKPLKKIINYFLTLFILNGILFIPFSFSFSAIQLKICQFIFLPIVEKITHHFQYNLLLTDFSSDSLAMYLLILILVIVSLLFSLFLFYIEKRKGYNLNIENKIRPIIRYYLALVLLIYGFSKVFKAQFYLPEPNLLFTHLGNLDKDILFWSTIGSSRSYSIFLGIIEIVPALLLLFRKTVFIGSLMATGVLLHIVAINFSYSISVKIFSLFLLILALFLAFKTIKNTWHLFQTGQFSTTDFFEPKRSYKKPFYPFLKSLIIVLLFIEALAPAIKSSNFNDDKVLRPLYHGAYNVQENQWGIKRFFIHRDGYLIFQDKNDSMTDYKFQLVNKNVFLLKDYQLNAQTGKLKWNPTSRKMELILNSIHLVGQQIDLKSLPLMKSQFSWTVDQ